MAGMIQPLGTILLTGVLLTIALGWLVAFWGALPRTSGTSPLAALYCLMCASTNAVAAVLTWRRSRLAAPAFVAAITLLLFPARYLVPGGEVFAPSFVVLAAIGLTGVLYLRRTALSRR
jgi:hypothetical protein